MAQSPGTTWTHKYDLGVFGEYSPTSSHIVMGYARQRKLVGIGGSLAWRLGFTHRRIQPELMGNVGFLIATRDIPVQDSSSFNFTFEIGAGLQWYRTPSQSIQAEVRYHHLSNDNLGTANPGVDSALWKVTYSFGRNHLLR
ncbi:MAG TPA: acyloxyacyl hydrolase [Acidobacteriaceae bacterium]|nr:acyloxyacyl hydrolase [Acidobacteriaceae bacterium]